VTSEHASVRAALRRPPGAPADPSRIDPAAIPVGPTSKGRAAADMTRVAPELDRLQEALYADGVAAGGQRRVLLVLQGMDTSGKGGTIRHVAGMLNPQGLHIASFKKPTPEELSHHFLWRIRRQVPAPGIIGVFDRSHYEDVLVVRVTGLVPEAQWHGRYDEINDFEDELVASGVTLVKCFLHISPEEQRARLLARLDNPDKHWKHNRTTSTSGPGGATTCGPTPTRCSAAARRPRPGMWCPATASGTATGRWPGSCWRRCASWGRASRRPTSTWPPSGKGS
jgi:hypothetical protein